MGTVTGALGKAKDTILSPYVWFFKKFIFYISIGGAIFLFILFIGFFINAWRTDTFDSILVMAGVQAENNGVIRVASTQGISFFEWWLDPRKLITKQVSLGPTDTVEETINLKIEEFKATPQDVDIGQPVIARAVIKAQAPVNKDITLDFTDSCFLSNYSGPITITVADPKNPNDFSKQRFIPEGRSDSFSVSCKFLNGLQTKQIAKLRLQPTFIYNQEVSWRVLAKGEYEMNDVSIPSTWGESKGPEIITFGSFDNQPFYTEEAHLLDIKLSQNLAWNGFIKEIMDIEINVPREARLLTQEVDCHFQDAGYNTYAIKYSALEKANIDCNNLEILKALGNSLRRPSMNTDDCLLAIKRQFEFTCPFQFSGIITKNAEEYPFKAIVKYKYQLNEAATVNINEPIFKDTGPYTPDVI
ncbi:MAG: hypothetical protein PHD81_02910 [Candidatus Nanoarchaeia archaeon]|nr:hypothetical protein [Candidatus Nanoarchaeia archaeon]MDD5588035.1 hypothetical protein [Candidatus Nanoarchaeia archaeon]